MLIQRAMLFAAGLGTRLRPLTEHTPKPLIEVGGRALIDYNLDHFAAHGCREIVVNTHHHADQVAAHVRSLHCPSEIHISHEPTLLETGGGVMQALPLLGPGPFFSANSDAFWIDGPRPALTRLAETFDPDRMDALLMLVHPRDAVGYRGAGNFDLDAAGRLARSSAPQLIFSGLQILHPRLFAGRDSAPFSLRALYQAAELPDGRLARMFGLVHDAAWVHVGSPEELAEAQRYLAARP